MDNLLKQTLEAINAGFDTFHKIKENNPSLAYQIEKCGGFGWAKEQLGFGAKRKLKNYWSNWVNLKKEIQSISINRKFPTVDEIKSHLGNGAYKAILKKHGGMGNVCNKLDMHRFLIAEDGHHLESSLELTFDNILFQNKIAHDVHGKIKNTNYRYDFRCGDIYFEIWGFENRGAIGNRYAKQREKKEHIYNENCLKLISIEYNEFDNMERLTEKILSVITCTNETPKIVNHVHCPKFWTLENTKNEITNLHNKLGHFPRLSEIKTEYPSLIYGVAINGGINNFKKYFGIPETSRPKKWTNNLAIKKLTELSIELGRLPTCQDLRNYKLTGLLSAIQKLGGMRKIKSQIQSLK